MARLRGRTYAEYAWPPAAAGLFARPWRFAFVAVCAGLALFLLLLVLNGGAALAARRPGDFFAYFPHGQLVTVFGAVFGGVMLALAVGLRRWCGISTGQALPSSRGAAGEAAAAVLTVEVPRRRPW